MVRMWAVSQCFWTACRRATTVLLRRCYHKSSIVIRYYSKKWSRRRGLSPRLSCNRINSILVHAFIQRARENLGRVVDSQNRIYCSFNRLLTGPTGLLLLVEAVNRPVGASLLLIDENGWLGGFQQVWQFFQCYEFMFSSSHAVPNETWYLLFYVLQGTDPVKKTLLSEILN